MQHNNHYVAQKVISKNKNRPKERGTTRMKRLSGFSLMEMMVVLLIVAVVAAASAPMVNKKMLNAAAEKSPWVWTGLNNSIAYNIQERENQIVNIGAMQSSDPARLHIKSNTAIPHIRFTGNDGDETDLKLRIGNNNGISFSNLERNIGACATAIGSHSEATANWATALGHNIASRGDRAIAIGVDTTTSGPAAISIGNSINNSGNRAISIGSRAASISNSAVAIGAGATSNGTLSLAIGGVNNPDNDRNQANGDYSIAIGGDSQSVKSAVALGVATRAATAGSIAIGAGATVSATNSAVSVDESDLALLTEIKDEDKNDNEFSNKFNITTQENGDSIANGVILPSAELACPKCGTYNPPKAKKCLNCGQFFLANLSCQHNDDAMTCDICSAPCFFCNERSLKSGMLVASGNGQTVYAHEFCFYTTDGGAICDNQTFQDWVDCAGVPGATGLHVLADYNGDGRCDICDPQPSPKTTYDLATEEILPSSSTSTSDVRGPSIAIGLQSEATSCGLALGHDTTARNSAIAIGNAVFGKGGPQATGNRSIAIGSASRSQTATTASQVCSMAIGVGATSSSNSGIAIGTEAVVGADSEDGIAIGRSTNASAKKSIAIGYDAEASGTESVAIGPGARATLTNQIVLGNANTSVYIPGKLIVDKHVYLAATSGHNVYLNTQREDSGKHDLFARIKRDYASTMTGDERNLEVDVTQGWTPGDDQRGGTQFYADSDRRLKDVGEVFTAGLEEIKKLEVFNFTYKKDPNKTPRVGVMAQDLQKIFPQAVFEGKDGFLRIRMEDMFYALVNAVKQLDAKIEEIKNNQIAQLLDKVTKLEEQNKKQVEINKKQEEMIEKLIKQNEEIISQNKEITKQNKQLVKQLKKQND